MPDVLEASNRSRLIIVGATQSAAALAVSSRAAGYRPTVVDARPLFARRVHPAVAPEDEPAVVIAWPHRYVAAEAAAGRLGAGDAVCVLSHDPRFDVPVLEVALRLPELDFVGVIASPHTQADRAERLVAAGLRAEELIRLVQPDEGDLAGRTPSERASSLVAGIVAARRLAQAEPPVELAS